MSLAYPSLVAVVGGAVAIVLAPTAAADPDIHTKSAAAVIVELQQQGYAVDVNGAPAGDASLLTTCTVTAIHHPGNPTPDAAVAPTVDVTVACPITHG